MYIELANKPSAKRYCDCIHGMAIKCSDNFTFPYTFVFMVSHLSIQLSFLFAIIALFGNAHNRSALTMLSTAVYCCHLVTVFIGISNHAT
jgi:hypothetical protein